MGDAQKTKAQLIQDLATLCQRVAALESAEVARSQAEVALREQDARIRALLETTLDGLISIDEQGRIESFNRAAERLFGYPKAEVIGQHVSMLISSLDCETHERYIARYLATDEKKILSIGREVVGLRKDGTTFPLDLAVREVRWNHRCLLLGMVRDMTACNRAEKAMQHADRLALAGLSTSSLAHEVGTPFTITNGNAARLRMDLNERGMPTDAVESIVEQADRMTGIIEQLLHVERAHALSLVPISVQVPLRSAIQLIEPRFRHEGITPIVEVPEDLPRVWGVSAHLEQVFLNVLVNSWHALPEGGTITIQADVPDDRCVRMTLEDNGIGMSAEVLGRIFEPFYTTKGECGTGLGLAVCRELIERCGGTIRLDSTPGVGTTVTMEFMRADTVKEGEDPARPRTSDDDTVSST